MLTDLVQGVEFDLNADGVVEQVAWTIPGSDEGFLWLDRNRNGFVDDGRELFGNFSPQPVSDAPNGFLALAALDMTSNGGNADGLIDKRDSAYSSLRLWQDLNHNGTSEAIELSGLAQFHVEAMSVVFKEAMRRDRWGNTFRYRAKVYGMNDSRLGRWAYDVLLLH